LRKAPKSAAAIGSLVAAIGSLGQILGVFKKLGLFTGTAGMVVGIICLLYLSIWGIIEAKSRQPTVRALAILSLVFGPVFSFYLILAVCVIKFEQPPLPLGVTVRETSEIFALPLEGSSDKAGGEHVLKFEPDGESVLVEFSPTGSDRESVRELEVTPLVPQNTKVTMVVRSDPMETAFLVEGTSRPSTMTASISVLLNNSKRTTALKILASYRYSKKTLWWRFVRWTFDEYS
jgi:hypothetical protein